MIVAVLDGSLRITLGAFVTVPHEAAVNVSGLVC